MPAAGFGGRFLHEDLFEMAAAYLFHIIRNHPFVDGNKRTGTVAALVFLIVNGIGVDADEDALEKTIIAVAEGKLNKRLSPISSESIHARSNTIRKIPADNAPTESDESEREPQRALHFSSFRHI
jgi:death-on-curing family protein